MRYHRQFYAFVDVADQMYQYKLLEKRNVWEAANIFETRINSDDRCSVEFMACLFISYVQPHGCIFRQSSHDFWHAVVCSLRAVLLCQGRWTS